MAFCTLASILIKEIRPWLKDETYSLNNLHSLMVESTPKSPWFK